MNKLIAQSKDETLLDCFKKLQQYYENHLLVGEKSVQFFQISRLQINDLIDKFLSHEIPETPFRDAYPFLLDSEALSSIDSGSKLSEIRKLETGLALIFCTKSFRVERTTIDPTTLDIDPSSVLFGYEKIFGIRRYIRQFFDVIFLRNDQDFIEVRMDITDDTNFQDRNDAFVGLLKQFNELARQKSGVKIALRKNINFFSLINYLYESNEGKVGELAFTTDEGSIKSEKMRRGKCDLRDETYHRAGREAVDHITPYRLAVIWEYCGEGKIETQPELFLVTPARTLSQENPELNEIIIRKCFGLEDYDFVLQKIVFYLENSD